MGPDGRKHKQHVMASGFAMPRMRERVVERDRDRETERQRQRD